MHVVLLLLVHVFLQFEACLASQKPNIVFILTDDQDTQLEGLEPLLKTRKLIGDAGIHFTNMFVSSPLCCPSRASILTGKYPHNNGAVNNSVAGDCSSKRWQKKSETKAFAPYLKLQGYTTFFAGKYLNKYGKKINGGAKHVPPGWDHWHGLMGNSVYYNYSLSVNGKKERHGADYKKDYLTDVVGRRAVEFIQQQDTSTPFCAMLATPACHAPFTPAPKYETKFANISAPRDPSFNIKGEDKHWLLRQVISPMSSKTIEGIDDRFRNRWRTLLSVDDMVENVFEVLRQRNMLDNTYVFFSSDNGFHLGQFSLPNDKRQMYEFDIRVPLMVRGPGINSHQIRQEAVVNIDFAPTFIDLAGGKPPRDMDGRSLKPLLHVTSDVLSKKKYFKKVRNWRNFFLVEHEGEGTFKLDKKCPEKSYQYLGECEPYAECVCEDARNNTYSCLRIIESGGRNRIYCLFDDTEAFVEAYDLNRDPFQLQNGISFLKHSHRKRLRRWLKQLQTCQGRSCWHRNNRSYKMLQKKWFSSKL